MLGAHDDHVAAVAIGDDLILQVLRRVAPARQALERRAQLRARCRRSASRMSRSAGLASSWTSPDGMDRAADGGGLRRERRDARRRWRRAAGCVALRRDARRRPIRPNRESAPGRAAASGVERLGPRRRARPARPARSSGASSDSEPPRLEKRDGFAGLIEPALDARRRRSTARAPGRARGREASALRAPAPRGCDRTRALEGQPIAWERPRSRGNPTL